MLKIVARFNQNQRKIVKQEIINKTYRQYRIIQVRGLRSKIFRQSVQIISTHTDVWVLILGQSGGIIFKQGVRRELFDVALIIPRINRKMSLLLLYSLTYGFVYRKKRRKNLFGTKVSSSPYNYQNLSPNHIVVFLYKTL